MTFWKDWFYGRIQLSPCCGREPSLRRRTGLTFQCRTCKTETHEHPELLEAMREWQDARHLVYCIFNFSDD